MFTGIFAWVTAHAGFAALTSVLGGGSALGIGAHALGAFAKAPSWVKRAVLGLAIAAAVVGALLVGWAVHAHKVKVFGDEREIAERGLWQAEMLRLKSEQEIRRQSDEASIRKLATDLADERAARRDLADTNDIKFMELENEDAKAGVAANPFDPRVLRLVR